MEIGTQTTASDWHAPFIFQHKFACFRMPPSFFIYSIGSGVGK